MNTITPRTPSLRVSRRHLLGIGAGGVLASALPASMAGARVLAPAWTTRRTPVRNIIFMAGDGMGQGSLTLGDIMLRVQGSEKPSHYRLLIEHSAVRRSTSLTHPADGWVTDSAAAGSAWGIGEHVNNRAINFTPDAREPEPILVTARKLGKRTGLVTTTRLTHATPASFIANVPKREMEDEIAVQMLDRHVDVALGGGEKHFPAQLLAKHADIHVVRDAAALASAPDAGRLLGLFNHDHVPFEIDREPSCPSLEAMSLAALDRLDRSPGGFVLQIEGGRIDHAAHDNDAIGLIYDQLAFDRAIGAVVQWVRGRDDTLLIVTSDHTTANPGLTFYGDDGRRSFKNLQNARHSFEWIAAQFKASEQTPARFVELAKEAAQVALTAEDAAHLARVFAESTQIDPFNLANAQWSVLGSVLANHTGVAFLSPNHTSDHVEVLSIGPGSESLPPFIDNIHLHGMMLAALGFEAGAPR